VDDDGGKAAVVLGESRVDFVDGAEPGHWLGAQPWWPIRPRRATGEPPPQPNIEAAAKDPPWFRAKTPETPSDALRRPETSLVLASG